MLILIAALLCQQSRLPMNETRVSKIANRKVNGFHVGWGLFSEKEMAMRAYEQIAIKTLDITKRIKDIGLIHPFNQNAEETKWTLDLVHAFNVYLHPGYSRSATGSQFIVELAFNYDIIPNRELELIHLLSGETVQLMQGEPGEGLSHLGYHVPDSDRLIAEIEWWNAMGYVCAQVSVTTVHSGTRKRYMYAFIDTRPMIGTFTKVISRMTYPRMTDSLIEEYSRVNTIRR